MTFLKSALVKSALAATVAAGALVGTAASGAVVCNGYECWHARDRLDYPTGIGVVVHDDAWAYRHHHGYRWRRDRDDRGYYRDGVWIAF